MSIDVEEFSRNLLLEAADDSLVFTHARQRNALWAIYGSIEHQEVLAETAEITLAPDTANVGLVLWNKKIIHRVNEDVLDAIDTQWRSATSGLPRNYIYRGEENQQLLRFHPRPAEAGRLQVIKQIPPPPGVAFWYNALLALLVTHQLSTSDVQRLRPDVAKTIAPIVEYIINGTATRLVHRR